MMQRRASSVSGELSGSELPGCDGATTTANRSSGVKRTDIISLATKPTRADPGVEPFGHDIDHAVAPALACGNAVILKPAEQAPLVPLRLAELFTDAGLPDGLFNVVTGDGSVGAAMVAHPGIAKISFTGSTATGQRIIAEGAKTLKRVTVELGGKSPTIIFADCDMGKAIPSAVMGFTAGSGQACVAGSRILVHESVYDEVATQITAAASALKVGGPFDMTSQITPIISQKQLDRITHYIDIGRSEGQPSPLAGRAMVTSASICSRRC